MNERELIAVGFTPRGNGALDSPGRITLAPAGADFFRMTIELPGNAVLSFHISKRALKIQREEIPR